MIEVRIRKDDARLHTVGDAWKEIDTPLTLEEFAFMVRGVNAMMADELAGCWRILLPAGMGTLNVVEKPVRKRAMDVRRTLESYGDANGPVKVYETGDTRYKVKYSSYAMHRVNQNLKFVCERELKDRIKEGV